VADNFLRNMRPMGNQHRRNKAISGRSALSGQYTSNPTGGASALTGVGQYAAGLLGSQFFGGGVPSLTRMSQAENQLRERQKMLDSARLTATGQSLLADPQQYGVTPRMQPPSVGGGQPAVVPPSIPQQTQQVQYSAPSYAPGEVFAQVQPLSPPPKTSMSMADAVAALARPAVAETAAQPPAPTMQPLPAASPSLLQQPAGPVTRAGVMPRRVSGFSMPSWGITVNNASAGNRAEVSQEPVPVTAEQYQMQPGLPRVNLGVSQPAIVPPQVPRMAESAQYSVPTYAPGGVFDPVYADAAEPVAPASSAQGVPGAAAAMAMQNAMLANLERMRPTQNPESMLPAQRREYEATYGAPAAAQQPSGNPLSAAQPAAQGPSYAMMGPGGQIAGGIGRGDYGVAEATRDLVQQQQLAAAQGALPPSAAELAETNRARLGQEASMLGGGAMQGVSNAFRSGLISDQPGNWADREMAAEQAMQQQANVQRGNRVMGEQLMRQRSSQDNGEGMYVRPLEGDERQGAGGFNFALTRRPGTDLVNPQTGKPLTDDEMNAYNRGGSARVEITRDEYYAGRKRVNDERVARNREAQGGYSDRQLRRMKPAAMASALMQTSDPRSRERMLQAMTPRKAAQVLDMLGKQKNSTAADANQQQLKTMPRVAVKKTVGGGIADSSRNQATQQIAERFNEESPVADHFRSLGLALDSSVASHFDAIERLMQQPHEDRDMMESVLREVVENAVDRSVVEAETGQTPDWAKDWVDSAPPTDAPIGQVYEWVVKEQERRRQESEGRRAGPATRGAAMSGAEARKRAKERRQQ
jgi:hypothetical protein